MILIRPLMLRYQQGDEEAFERLFGKHFAAVVNFAFRFVHSRELAEDIAQEVFLKVHRARERYRLEAKFTTWLFVIARHCCLDVLRTQDYRVFSSIEPIHSDVGDAGGLEKDFPDSRREESMEQVIGAELAPRIQAALGMLPPRQRLALLLNAIHEFSLKEIAEVLSCSGSAVKDLLFRARRDLKEELIE